MLTFKSFTGINNVLPEHRMGSGDMLQASNVDIGSTGEIARRAGLKWRGAYRILEQAKAAGHRVAKIQSAGGRPAFQILLNGGSDGAEKV